MSIDTEHTENEPGLESEPTHSDIPKDVRAALQLPREISYGEWGEGSKTVNVYVDNKRYEISRSTDHHSWYIDVYNEHDQFETNIEITEEADEEYLEELFEQDIPEGLRNLLDTKREINYGQDGEEGKRVGTELNGITYLFCRDDGEYADWKMERYDEYYHYMDSTDIREETDVEYLEKLFEQDIPEGLRNALNENRTVSSGHNGTEVSVEYHGITYSFSRFNGEYADWKMERYDEQGEYMDSTDIREETDVEYLEKLFDTPTREEQIAALEDDLQ